jgi:methionyl-tRNA formyltransferase
MVKLNTIFFGTPEIAVPFLERTHDLTNIKLVVTQADKPRGRGMEISACPVKKRAQELGLPVLSPEKLKDSFDDISQIPFDVGIVVAYGKIFRPNFIALPKLGLINVHFSLLPHLRGAAPVQQALIQGYTQTGVSTFWISEGMDDGPLFLQKKLDIAPQDNAKTLFEKLTALGLDALQETISELERGHLLRTPQTGTPTLAPMLQKEEALLRPAQLGAEELHNRVRGLACGPKPKVPFLHNGQTEWLQLLHTEVSAQDGAQAPGTVLAVERGRGILVKCKEGALWLIEVQPAGKKPMAAADFANGRNLKTGDTVFVEK